MKKSWCQQSSPSQKAQNSTDKVPLQRHYIYTICLKWSTALWMCWRCCRVWNLSTMKACTVLMSHHCKECGQSVEMAHTCNDVASAHIYSASYSCLSPCQLVQLSPAMIAQSEFISSGRHKTLTILHHCRQWSHSVGKANTANIVTTLRPKYVSVLSCLFVLSRLLVLHWIYTWKLTKHLLLNSWNRSTIYQVTIR